MEPVTLFLLAIMILVIIGGLLVKKYSKLE